ncbi:MAG: gamma-glutamyl-gamma-aminobutyrate hydrolase family protein, partial [Salinibacter sp.]
MPARIGITTSFEEGEQHLDRRYVTAIENAGGVPVLLPTTTSADTVDGLTDHIDGLVVPG